MMDGVGCGQVGGVHDSAMIDHNNNNQQQQLEQQQQFFRLVETFRPVLELLFWPSSPPGNSCGRSGGGNDGGFNVDVVDYDLHSNPAVVSLVHFFKQHGVFYLGALGSMDSHHFIQKREECPVFESDNVVGQLGYICRFIAFKGQYAFLALLNKHRQNQHNNHNKNSSSSRNHWTTSIMNKIENAVAKHVAKHNLYSIGPDGINLNNRRLPQHEQQQQHRQEPDEQQPAGGGGGNTAADPELSCSSASSCDLLDASPRGLNNLSLLQGRRWFQHLLGKLDLWKLHNNNNNHHHHHHRNNTNNPQQDDAIERQIWLRRGALHILDRFPVLTDEQFIVAPPPDDHWQHQHQQQQQVLYGGPPVKLNALPDSATIRLYPYAFLLWGGFEKNTIKHVVDLCPRARLDDIRKGAHLNFLLRCNAPLPLPVIQTLLAVNKNLLLAREVRDRRTNPLLELLIRYGYPAEVLDHVLRHVSRDINCLWLSNFDGNPELGEAQAKAVDALLPQLVYLECRLPWSIQAETLLLLNITDRCRQGDCMLESLKISLSPFAFYNDPIIRNAMRNFMANLNKSLKVLSITMFDDPQLAHRLLPDRFRRQASDICLFAILDGLNSTRKRKGRQLAQLTLQGFSLSNSRGLDQLLLREEIGSINIQFDSREDRYNFKTMPLHGRPRIQQLNLYECSLSEPAQAEESWHEFWRSLSRCSALECVLLVPRHHNIATHWIPHALEACRMLPALRRLELGPHSYIGRNIDDYVNECADITDPLSGLLSGGSIEYLKIHGHGNQYLIHAQDFFHALSLNNSLRSLDLLGVFLDGRDTTKCFLDALLLENNVTLQHATVYDDRYFYTPTTIDTHRKKYNNFEHYKYENYDFSSMIQHVCHSNKCGRGRIHKGTKVWDLVLLLGRVRDTLGIESEDVELLRWMDYGDWAWPSDVHHLNELYRYIGKFPMMLCRASQLAHDTVSIQYTLLRENPGIWCHTLACDDDNDKHDGDDGTPRKRQRVG